MDYNLWTKIGIQESMLIIQIQVSKYINNWKRRNCDLHISRIANDKCRSNNRARKITCKPHGNN